MKKKSKKPDFGNFGVYFVGFKLALWKGGRILLLQDRNYGWRDLPGGRTENTEYERPIEKILVREVREEIGRVRYTLGKPAFQYRRWHSTRHVHILTTVYEAQYISGRVVLSEEHGSYEWVIPRDVRFSPDDFSSREEHRAFKKYFAEVKKKK